MNRGENLCCVLLPAEGAEDALVSPHMRVIWQDPFLYALHSYWSLRLYRSLPSLYLSLSPPQGDRQQRHLEEEDANRHRQRVQPRGVHGQDHPHAQQGGIHPDDLTHSAPLPPITGPCINDVSREGEKGERVIQIQTKGRVVA